VYPPYPGRKHCPSADLNAHAPQHSDTWRWEEQYVYRGAWRNIRNWTMAQLALNETEIVEMPQMVFPCATDAPGQTLYEKMLKGTLLLGPGSEDEMQKRWLRLILLLVVVFMQGCCWSNCPPGNSAVRWHTPIHDAQDS
jgi:hypothetical protein